MKGHPLDAVWQPMTDYDKGAVMGRIAVHDATRLNAVAEAVIKVQGYAPLSERYSIAILALEALAELNTPDFGTSD